MLERGINRPSNTPYSSRNVLVKKKTGDFRLCVDDRGLNWITVKDNFPIPLIDDHLKMLWDKCVFTSLDLKNAFHHIRIDDESVKLT